ncbi:MAG: hypothetical protein HRU41_34705 [Saprospiraceae bacterium]|nr:hypothetical protein [Saprospiraceae bacterium]
MKNFRKFMAAMTVAATLCLPGCPEEFCNGGGGEEIEGCEDCTGQIINVQDQDQLLAILER